MTEIINEVSKEIMSFIIAIVGDNNGQVIDAYSKDNRFNLKGVFDNNYGISIAKNELTHYEYEVATIDKKGKLIFDTPVMNDAVGGCDADEVIDYINQIAKLPTKEKK